MKVLVAAGLDPSGGAGLVADQEALAAAGVGIYAVATALTAQGARGARSFEPVSSRYVGAQLDALLEAGGERPAALKTGMLGSFETARLLAERFSARSLARLPLVVDPVLSASSGLPLIAGARARAGRLLAPLLERASLATPNLPELAILSGRDLSPAADEAAIVAAARLLPARAVLVKGGHRQGAPVDLLVTRGAVTRFSGRRRAGTARGTGCRLASGIAAHLARGAPIEEAIRRAKRLVERYLDVAGR